MKTEYPRTKKLIDKLLSENIKTWFDLGLFLDRLKEEKSNAAFNGSYEEYKKEINQNAIAFLSFHFTIDGITVEVEKYAQILKQLFPQAKVHFIAGEIHEEAKDMIDDTFFKKEIPELKAFDDWHLYSDFFEIKMERGSQAYNELIGKFWKDVLNITEKLGHYIEQHQFKLLYQVNVNSNPGNVSFALAMVLISEYFGIPIINNNHDFYWEGGRRAVEREEKNLEKGTRDFFFYNSHVGEFFSVIEQIYPWNSRSWMNVNINNIQKDHLIEKNGINPSNIELIGTAIDNTAFKPLSKRDSIKAYMQVASIFANKKQSITVHKAHYHKPSERSLLPILFGNKTLKDFDFVNNNIVFLQPTRVISRKNIETNFKLVQNLFYNDNFTQKFRDNPQLHLSIIVTGPIPQGQQNYYEQLISDFSNFLSQLPEEFRDSIYLGFLFSEFDKYEFRKKFNTPIDIRQLYNVASLILLPSQTEGRGLPIIEAAASGTPIFCRQYEPRKVYEEVIGYHLSEKDRLQVLEFRGDAIPQKLITKIINHVFYPQNSLEDVSHNYDVIKRRFSIGALKEDLKTIIHKQFIQLSSINSDHSQMKDIVKEYQTLCHFQNDNLKSILNTQTRHYLAGYNRYAFMIYLKSLIDPSFFRVEEQFNRGEIFAYAKQIETVLKGKDYADTEDLHQFYNTIEDVFSYSDGENKLRHDHALSYRHRNKIHYPYQDFTFQEMTGLVNMIYYRLLKPEPKKNILLSPKFFTDWNLALFQLTNSQTLSIDDRELLTQKLKENVPKGYFSGRYIEHELEYFVLQPIRAQLKLSIEEELTETILNDHIEQLKKVYIFIHEPSVTEWFSSSEIKDYLKNGPEKGLTLLYKAQIIEIVETQQWSNGVHFPQMGELAIAKLKYIKENNGFIITNGEYSAMMTDIVNIDHFHIGTAERKMTAKIMGIPHNSGFIQFVPAGLRTTLAYPTPIQTSKDFDEALKSPLFKALKKELGEQKLYNLLRIDAEENGTPIKTFLTNLKKNLDGEITKEKVTSTFVGGVYSDGLPWSGVTADIDTTKFNWKFAAHFAKAEPKNVPALIDEFKTETGFNQNIELAWNGGYILNPELVGKLGLPETYIGSPLGLLIMDGTVKCPPLFNKPAFIIYKNGKVDIQKVSSNVGFKVEAEGKELVFSAQNYNVYSSTEASFYDLFFETEEIIANGNVIVRMAGNTIKQIIHTQNQESVKIIPVGITLSIPKEIFDETLFQENKEVNIELFNPEDQSIDWSEISYAIEAGPMLIENGKEVVNMEIEGWKSTNSIKTQAARLDFTDMRGPKIAVGIDEAGKLKVLMINGRIRESVGATHFDMADILLKSGIKKAMGFDPGGSSTLVVNDQIMNISPYNKNYEKDIYSLPPEPRFVSNIVMAWTE